MKKRIVSLACAAVMMFSGLYGVQAATEDTIWQAEENIADDLNTSDENLESKDDFEAIEKNENSNGDVDVDLDNTDENTSDVNDTDVIFEENEAVDDNSLENEADEDLEEEEIEESDVEETLFCDAEEVEAANVRGSSSIPVDWVDANYRMREDYAFTYAFREGVTNLSYISRYNAGLNNKLHNWFGNGMGYTEEYCKTFYACLIDADKYTEPITAVYSNVGEYQGQIVDLRVTVPQWGTVNKNHIGKDGSKMSPCVMFYKDRIAFNTVAVGIVRFTFEFLKHGTNEQIYPKGHVTAADLDGGQGIRVYDYWGIDRIYLRKGYDYLKVKTGTTANGSGYREIRSSEGSGSLDNSDVKGWCQLDFNGSFTLNWLSQDSWKNSTGVQNAFYVSTGQTAGTYEPNPGPEKRVGNVDESYESMRRHEFTESDPPYEITEGKYFDYVIKQRLLPGNYDCFEVKDELDSCLKYCGASVVTSLGNDVTNRFRIENINNTIYFSADPGFLKTDEAYNDLVYYFRIKVQAGSNQEIDAHNHYQKSKEYYAIVNRATRTIRSDRMQDIQNTNESWVKGSIILSDGEIIVTKKIKEADIIWAHGNPVFRFRVTGKDQKGIMHVYENYVEFEPGKYKVSGEDAVMSCCFKNIQSGRYTVSELSTLRYRFESIAADTENVTISGKTGIAAVDCRQKKAGVTFRNKKTRYDRYSHTDVIRNIIPVAK